MTAHACGVSSPHSPFSSPAGPLAPRRRQARPPPRHPRPSRPWSFYASASTYILPDDPDYVQPAFTADRGWLHLEGRFNYEDRDTGSAWFGYNFSVGDTVTLEFTPMIGAVFGTTDGIAPGYKGIAGLGHAPALQRNGVRDRRR